MKDKHALVEIADRLADVSIPERSPVQLIGEHGERYERFARAAARLRITGDAHMKAQEEYKTSLALLSSSAERWITGDGQLEPV